ncbi:MAG: SGNH/GDSL hydrolase family protein [Bacteroidetes bacterium]|nr:SGNH/GDSL hydrolase family protein [Bacteroidota bacterium]MBU1485774.1 SGNH/GDSL hydrolase family protein [Bacteroidota bacterium]MBU2046910.1 SGNH/GDSL hydrolase family protein [Bacteroidota bacterium]MBU2269599.1 SGNH/GDSL hydrolase family protein [Bacteroidota bacterium]MBU2376285.1 SGNH/GDSL hydrolase family protein [Bacteroidota bacterium]
MTFNRVLILGNSITFHKADESLGWKNNWGMAASVQDSDYVHILTRKFKIENPEVNLKYINFSQFENEYEKYSLNNIDSLKQFKPNLLILRIGENVNVNKIEINDFSAHYKDLIKYFQNNNPSLKVICVSNFWRSPEVEDIIKKSANSEGASYVSLSHLDKEEFTAWGLFNNPAVGSHPGNKGMKAIADLIWQEIVKIN